MINFFQHLATIINAVTEWLGRTIAWLTLAMVVVTCAVVFMRYYLQAGSIALQESVTYMHALVFLLGAAYTLKHGGHVRVDIFYRRFTPRKQAVVDIIGGLVFLMPVALLLLLFCWDYVASSWAIQETSGESSGLPFVYLLKSLLIVMPITLLLQAIAEIIQNMLFACGIGGNHQPASLEGAL